jgi:hypothetical protein
MSSRESFIVLSSVVKGLSSVGAEISPREYIRIVRCNMQAKIFIQKNFKRMGLVPYNSWCCLNELHPSKFSFHWKVGES